MQYGPNPELPQPQRGMLPNMTIAEPAQWGDQQPRVPQGYAITAIATDLKIPRQTLLLPNGDILVAEGKGGNAPSLKPKDVIAGYIKAKGTSPVKGGNRLTLLRDADGDGVYELADRLCRKPECALRTWRSSTAPSTSPTRTPWCDSTTRTARPRPARPPTKVTDLPSAINHHWTKALAASADGRFLYVGIGSNSNITERGMTAEVDRAMVWQVDARTGCAQALRDRPAQSHRAGHPARHRATVGGRERARRNRSEPGARLPHLGARRRLLRLAVQLLGPERGHRACARRIRRRSQSAITPDYALGSHVAALGVAFSNAAMGEPFADGVFVGEHGSWNRPRSGGLQGDLRTVP